MTNRDKGGGISIERVSHAYGSKTALSDVNLSAPKGRFTALLGPNGAGKSTLFSLLTRLFVAQQGAISLGGIDLSGNPRAALAKIGVVFQQPTLDLDLSVRRNLRYFAALHGLSGAKAEQRIDASLERLGMAERSDEKARDLNGGHRRRTEIARSLLHDPAILLLDEPTVGLDAASRRAITEHVHDLCEERGLCVLWATHLVDEVRAKDHLIILHQGKVLAEDDAETIADGQSLEARFLLLTGGGER